MVIKLVLFGPDFDWADLKLFEREAETLKSLEHLAIPKYLDSVEVDTPLGKGFALVQTYIEAQSLEAWSALLDGGGSYTVETPSSPATLITPST